MKTEVAITFSRLVLMTFIGLVLAAEETQTQKIDTLIDKMSQGLNVIETAGVSLRQTVIFTTSNLFGRNGIVIGFIFC